METTTMKDFHCRDAGLDCDFVAKGASNEDILKQIAPHAEKSHNMKVTPELKQKVEGLIHEETSDAHTKSGQPRR